MGVAEWFSDFCSQLGIGAERRNSIAYRAQRMVGQLNLDMRGVNSNTSNRFYVGSYGRNTATRNVSDVDILYELPASLYYQYEDYIANGQSALLSAVRTSIQRTYPSSYIAGDGQVVVVQFTDGVRFEVLPAFANRGGGYTFADANSGGSWKTCRPKEEMDAFGKRDAECNGNLVKLGRMARAWRDYNGVPMNGMLLDTLVYQFMEAWWAKDKSYLYYDCLTEDFFGFLAGQSESQEYWRAPGSGSPVLRQGKFEYKARQAELRAREAISYQSNGQEWSAKQKYREIYGTAFPD